MTVLQEIGFRSGVRCPLRVMLHRSGPGGNWGAATAMLNWYRAIRLRSFRTLNLTQVIDVPTLVVWGDRDVALDPICLNGTERYVRDLTVKRLPGVSHWVQQDAPHGRVADRNALRAAAGCALNRSSA